MQLMRTTVRENNIYKWAAQLLIQLLQRTRRSRAAMGEALSMADRILVMSKGKITREFDRTNASEEALVEASAIGHELVKVPTGGNGE